MGTVLYGPFALLFAVRLAEFAVEAGISVSLALAAALGAVLLVSHRLMRSNRIGQSILLLILALVAAAAPLWFAGVANVVRGGFPA